VPFAVDAWLMLLPLQRDADTLLQHAPSAYALLLRVYAI